uniref:Uncharacterized protein n=1 Tax=Anguilla anguilla TaxID=7936 RepID=A0A0E9UJP4_ANGAN
MFMIYYFLLCWVCTEVALFFNCVYFCCVSSVGT